jgi:hypothetical protein
LVFFIEIEMFQVPSPGGVEKSESKKNSLQSTVGVPGQPGRYVRKYAFYNAEQLRFVHHALVLTIK